MSRDVVGNDAVDEKRLLSPSHKSIRKGWQWVMDDLTYGAVAIFPLFWGGGGVSIHERPSF